MFITQTTKNIYTEIASADDDGGHEFLVERRVEVVREAASELGPEFKITTLVGSRIILGTTMVGFRICIGTTLVVS
jgi:predicted RNA-binding protein